jgi:hypothetical protein
LALQQFGYDPVCGIDDPGERAFKT